MSYPTPDVNSPLHNFDKKDVPPSVIGVRKVPQILSLAANRVEQWGEHSWKWLRRIRFALLERFANGRRLSSRTMRKDQRGAIVALTRVLLSHLDLKTMQVGVYNPETGVFVHLTLEYLAHKAGLTYSQAQRAMAWMYESGYVMGFRQSSFDMNTNEYVNKPSIRRISNHLLTDLGITDLAFNKARAQSSKSSMKQRVGRFVTKAATQVKGACSAIFKSVPTSSPKSKANTMSMAEYVEKIRYIMEHIPGTSFEEAQGMLPKPSS